jgi:hypothetical protein
MRAAGRPAAAPRAAEALPARAPLGRHCSAPGPARAARRRLPYRTDLKRRGRSHAPCRNTTAIAPAGSGACGGPRLPTAPPARRRRTPPSLGTEGPGLAQRPLWPPRPLFSYAQLGPPTGQSRPAPHRRWKERGRAPGGADLGRARQPRPFPAPAAPPPPRRTPRTAPPPGARGLVLGWAPKTNALNPPLPAQAAPWARPPCLPRPPT